jgi:hypothetical protein
LSPKPLRCLESIVANSAIKVNKRARMKYSNGLQIGGFITKHAAPVFVWVRALIFRLR